MRLGAGLTLTDSSCATSARARAVPGLWQAAVQVATPHLRNMGTLGGNLCLDTRCTYYDQNYEWRKAIDFCMKKDGETCWVAPSSPRCLAVSSTDTAPGADRAGRQGHAGLVTAANARSAGRTVRNDGIDYIDAAARRDPDRDRARAGDGWKQHLLEAAPARHRSTFPCSRWRRRPGCRGPTEPSSARGSCSEPSPRAPCSRTEAASAFLEGKPLTDDESIAEPATLAAKLAKPMDNTDFTLHWRKVRRPTPCASVRGDDMRAIRQRIARHSLDTAGA